MQQLQFTQEYLLSICLPEQREHYVKLYEMLAEAKAKEDQVSEQINKEDLKKLRISIDTKSENLEQSQIIIVRHALAWHNYFTRSTGFSIKNIYHYDLVDPPLHRIGKLQCEIMSQELAHFRFSMVLVSPLLRAIETAQLLFKDHPLKHEAQFKILPLLTEKVSSQHSLYKWGNLTKLKQQNGNPIHFDFSELQDLEFWQMNLLGQQSLILNQEPTRENQESFICHQFISKGKPIAFENTEILHQRTETLIEQLKAIKTEHKICIITHSQLLKAILKEEHIPFQNGVMLGIQLI